MSTDQVQTVESSRPPRVVRLKSAFYFCVVLALVLLAVLLIKSLQFRAALKSSAEEYATAIKSNTDASAKALASSVAILGNQRIVSRDYQDLQADCDELVRNRPLAYIAVSDPKGQVVVHTNREFVGRRIGEVEAPSDVVEASSAVMSKTKRVGTVYVGVRLK